jgi:hypothetical protein
MEQERTLELGGAAGAGEVFAGGEFCRQGPVREVARRVLSCLAWIVDSYALGNEQIYMLVGREEGSLDGPTFP